MIFSPRKIRNYAAVLVSGGLTGVLVVWPRLQWPGQPPPNLLTTGPAGGALLMAGFALATAATAFLLPMLTPGRRLTNGLFFLTIGLAVLSVLSTGEMPGRLQLTGGLLLLRGAELLLLAAILFGGMVVRDWALRRYWPALLGPAGALQAEPAEAATLLPTRDELRARGLYYLIVASALGYVLSTQFVLGDGRGQAAFGTWAAFLVATTAARSILPVRETLWLASPPLAVGMVGYVAAGLYFGQNAVPPDTGALMALANPCDFAGPAVAGCVMGFWISEKLGPWLRERLSMERRHRQERRQLTRRSFNKGEPRKGKPAKPSARTRSRRPRK